MLDKIGYIEMIKALSVVLWVTALLCILYLDLLSYYDVLTTGDPMPLINRDLNVIVFHILCTFPLTIYFMVKVMRWTYKNV